MEPLAIEKLRTLVTYDEKTDNLHNATSRGRAKRGNVAGTLTADGQTIICIEGTHYYKDALKTFWLTGSLVKQERRLPPVKATAATANDNGIT